MGSKSKEGRGNLKQNNVDRMAIEWITRATGDSRFRRIVGSLLLRSVPQSELNEMISEDLGISDPKVLQKTRMDLIGNLRWRGYEVPRGKRGQQAYQITGWSKPRPQDYDEDPRDLRAADQVGLLEPFDGSSSDHIEVLQQKMSRRRKNHISFENCVGYVLSYGFARYDLFWGPGRNSLVFRRFPHHPRYLVMALDDHFERHIELGRALLGTRKITVFNLNSLWRDSISGVGFEWKSRRQCLYGTADIAFHPEAYLSSSQMSLLRKLGRETKFTRLNGDECRRVIDRWAAVNKKKHPQIALGRDYEAVCRWWPQKIPPLGCLRDGDPVAFAIFDRLPNDPGVAIHLVEKSLNYRVDEMPGGRSGTSDFNLYMYCRELYDRGVVWVNGGQYQSVGSGLARYKQRFSFDYYRAYEVVLEPGEGK